MTSPLPEKFQLIVPQTIHTIRLDRWLVGEFPDHSRSEVQSWIRDGHVISAEGKLRPGSSAVPGMTLAFSIPVKTSESLPIPQDLPVDILYEDQDLVAVCKIPGQVVHPAPGHEEGTLLNAMLNRYPAMATAGDPQRPGVVHRLDVGTSGVILFALNEETLLLLQETFKQRKISKIYHCVCHGIPDPYAQTINLPIGRHPAQWKKRAIDGLSAREAISHIRLLKGVAGGTGGLLEVEIETGRTHQIRVHLAHVGHSVIGDTTYGGKRAQLSKPWCQAARPMLHARQVELPHPRTGKLLKIEADYPDDFRNFLDAL